MPLGLHGLPSARAQTRSWYLTASNNEILPMKGYCMTAVNFRLSVS